MQVLYVGIDPQEKLMGIHAIDGNDNIFIWEAFWFRKKTTYKQVQGWQEYIWTSVYNYLGEIKEKYKNTHQIYVGIEQQRGRVASMIEQSLLCACMCHGLPRILMHPNTWKKTIDFCSEKGNAANKKRSIELCLPLIKLSYPHFLQMERMHDICDARLISRALSKIHQDTTHSKNELDLP